MQLKNVLIQKTGKKTKMKSLLKSILIITFSYFIVLEPSQAQDRKHSFSVCGTEDRTLSYDRSVGRLRKTKRGFLFCTATLIGKSCAISAGHCAPVMQKIGFDIKVEENKFNYASKEDLYEVDKSSRILKSNGKGSDWAVFRLKKNKHTNKFPGEVRPIYEVSYNHPKIGSEIEVFGYGGAKNLYSYSQQVGPGTLLKVEDNYLEHTSDTKGGSSGAPIIDPTTGKVFGIHTHGNCKEGWNSGTYIGGVPELISAISSCLEWENENL
jgi:V8-like Glu-specific endopeptidase